MPLYIPGTDNMYESGLDNLVRAMFGDAVVNGCQVVERAPQIMGIRVGAGAIYGNGAYVPVGQTDIAIDVGGAQPRVDLISVNVATGVATKTVGTPAVTPKPPALPATDILLGYVSVGVGAVIVTNANIIDRRIIRQLRSPSGTLATRPAAGSKGVSYYVVDLDQPEMYRDNGVNWDSITARYSNQVLNGDFARRPYPLKLAMSDAFVDSSGYTVISGGGTVAANIFTANAANPEIGFCNLAFGWREGRVSATFKAVAAAGQYAVVWRSTAGLYVRSEIAAGTFRIVLDGVTQASVAQALTVNRWYWLEFEQQGNVAIAKIYDTGGTVPGVLKAASTLLQTLVYPSLSGAQSVRANHISLLSDQANVQWGGISAANGGGVVVEAPLPESWSFSFDGTLGGQAVCIDEDADSGPINRQGALRVYIPPAANARRIIAFQEGVDGEAMPNARYSHSCYVKTANTTSAGLFFFRIYEETSALGLGTPIDVQDGQEVVWTRKPTTWGPVAGTTRRFGRYMYFNGGVAPNQGGTFWVHLLQLELGSVATAWRKAPGDDATAQASVSSGLVYTTTSAAFVQLDERDLAMDFIAPWDCMLDVTVLGNWSNSTTPGSNFADILIDGGAGSADGLAIGGHTTVSPFQAKRRLAVSAGKHRIVARFRVTAGTLTVGSVNQLTQLLVTATRGK